MDDRPPGAYFPYRVDWVLVISSYSSMAGIVSVLQSLLGVSFHIVLYAPLFVLTNSCTAYSSELVAVFKVKSRKNKKIILVKYISNLSTVLLQSLFVLVFPFIEN